MDNREEIKSILFHLKTTGILTTLKEEQELNIANIAKKTGATYVHTFNTINKLEEGGLIISQHEGKKRIVKLTEKGQQIALKLEEIIEKIENLTIEELEKQKEKN